MSKTLKMPPITCRQAVEAWDRGEGVWTIERGGLGPGYEQCIQVLVVEVVRELLDFPVADFSQDEYRRRAGVVAKRLDSLPGFGFSGAQVGVAFDLAYRYLTRGWGVVVDEAGERKGVHLIQVSREWPQAPEAPC